MTTFRWLYAALLIAALGAWQWEHRQRVAAETALLVSKRLNDSTTVRVASSKAAVPETIDHAAAEFGGRVIASVRLKVAPRDTAIAHDTLPTTLTPDSTRRATFRDSTFAGILEGEMVAPPCCAPLALSYRIHRPAFEPAIGFIQSGKGYAAVVTWQGERAELGTPFVAKNLAPQRTLAPFTQATWSPDGVWAAAVGIEGRAIFGVRPVAQIEQRFARGESLRVGIGLRKVF